MPFNGEVLRAGEKEVRQLTSFANLVSAELSKPSHNVW